MGSFRGFKPRKELDRTYLYNLSHNLPGILSPLSKTTSGYSSSPLSTAEELPLFLRSSLILHSLNHKVLIVTQSCILDINSQSLLSRANELTQSSHLKHQLQELFTVANLHLSTQLIKPNHLVLPPTDVAPKSL